MDAIVWGGCAGWHLHGASRHLSRACIIALVNLYKTRSEHNEFAMPPKVFVKADVADRQGWAISGCSGVWLPPPKYRNKEACNQNNYLDADLYPVLDRRGIRSI
jgi:hypothetical protein